MNMASLFGFVCGIIAVGCGLFLLTTTHDNLTFTLVGFTCVIGGGFGAGLNLRSMLD